MQMRTGGASGCPDQPNALAAFNRIAGFHQPLALMQIGGGDALAVIDQGQAAIQIIIVADADGIICVPSALTEPAPIIIVEASAISAALPVTEPAPIIVAAAFGVWTAFAVTDPAPMIVLDAVTRWLAPLLTEPAPPIVAAAFGV